MGFRRRDRRGLAEIVGTLMLVLIVVAAVTAFSFYIATQEQQTLAERTALHYKNLENVTVQAVVFGNNTTTQTPYIVLDLSSTDIYQTYVTDVSINGNPATGYCVQFQSNCTTFPVFSGTPLTLDQFSVTPIIFNTTNNTQFYLPWVSPTHSLLVNIGTSRGNEFQDTLFAPVSKLDVQFVDNYPILDGTGSYQPHEGTFVNATIDEWNWSIQNVSGLQQFPGNFFGQQVELFEPLYAGMGYNITLTTTNTLGLSDSVTELFKVP